MDEKDLHWLAGLLEGEGSFLAGPPSAPNMPRVALSMCDEDVVRRAASLLGTKVHFRKRAQAHHRDAYFTSARGPRAVELMVWLRPYMGRRRTEQIDKAIASYSYNRRSRLTFDQAEKIRKRFKAGEAATSLADEYGVTKWMIYSICQGKSYATKNRSNSGL